MLEVQGYVLSCGSYRSLNTGFTNGKKSVSICGFEMNLIQSNNMYFQYKKKKITWAFLIRF